MTDVAHDETLVEVSTSRQTVRQEVLDRRRYIPQDRRLFSPTFLAFSDDVSEADDPADPGRFAVSEPDRRVALDDTSPEPHLAVDDVDERPLAAPGQGVPYLLGELVPRHPLRVESPDPIQRPADHPQVQ